MCMCVCVCVSQGTSKKDAARVVAQATGLKRKDLYSLALTLKVPSGDPV